MHAPYLAAGGQLDGMIAALYANVAGLLGLELLFTWCPESWLLCWEVDG